MSDRPRFAVIPTNDRDCLAQCLEAIRPQVDRVLLVHTEHVSRGRVLDLAQSDWPYLFHMWDTEGINISRWWNIGLDTLREEVKDCAPVPEAWDVAILNDDAIVPPGWMDAVCATLRPCVAASGGAGYMEGFAFVLAGESGLRADEQFRWYCGDNDLEYQAKRAGGVAKVLNVPVRHLYPNGQVTPEMHALIAEDMQRFVDKWGERPGW